MKVLWDMVRKVWSKLYWYILALLTVLAIISHSQHTEINLSDGYVVFVFPKTSWSQEPWISIDTRKIDQR